MRATELNHLYCILHQHLPHAITSFQSIGSFGLNHKAILILHLGQYDSMPFISVFIDEIHCIVLLFHNKNYSKRMSFKCHFGIFPDPPNYRNKSGVTPKSKSVKLSSKGLDGMASFSRSESEERHTSSPMVATSVHHSVAHKVKSIFDTCL
jgi:hypothetical protein